MIQGVKRARTASQTSESEFEAEGIALIPGPKPPVINDEQRSVYNDVSRAGKERYTLESDLALLLLLTICGITYNTVDHVRWKSFVAQISGGRYVSKSSTTIREAHLEKEAQMCRTYIIAHLSSQENLTITFDRQTIRKPQAIYTVHVTTADRRIFLVNWSKVT